MNLFTFELVNLFTFELVNLFTFELVNLFTFELANLRTFSSENVVDDLVPGQVILYFPFSYKQVFFLVDHYFGRTVA